MPMPPFFAAMITPDIAAMLPIFRFDFAIFAMLFAYFLDATTR